ncbi:MAG TPA: peptidyl-prolyl cis-trans isomerase [Roseomonas sp.]|nr:peptidyl-prolyl cis-trans isomerase [Roseomonas sp.]
MLTALRRLAGTWFAKALFLLLILSFGIWGIEDIVRRIGTDTAVARVGGARIELTEAQQAARRDMLRMQRQLGANFEMNPAMAQAIGRQAVEQLIMDRVQREEAARLHVAVPEEALRDYIFGIPAFRGSDGRFSRTLLDGFLRNNGLSEGEFLTLLRADLQRQQLVGAVRAGAAGPDALTKPLLAWEREQRVADLVRLPFAAAPEPAAPEEAQLRRFHENNLERFSSPEYRRYTLAVLSPETVAAEIKPTEEDLHAAYEAHRGEFETPERRTVEQALLPSKEQAEAVAAQWRGGADFAAIEAAAQQAGGQAVSLGTTDRSGLPVQELAQAAFSLPENGVSDPVQTSFGWHVLKVTAIEPEKVRGFDTVRDELSALVRRDRAADLTYERANQVEDALAGGATLDEVAKRFGLALAEVTTDASGQTQAGTRADLPLGGAAEDIALRAIFAAQQGEAPRLAEAGQTALFAFELKEVIPAALRPFEQVEAKVREAWTADARRRAQEERAAALLTAVKGGKPLAEAAREAGLAVQRIGPFGRQPQPNTPLPAELQRPVFDTPPDQATMAETSDGFAVAQTVQVVPFNPDSDPLALGRVRDGVEQAMLNDLEAQYLDALRAQAEITYNETLLGQVTPR